MVNFSLKLRHKIFLAVFIILFTAVIISFNLPFIFKTASLHLKHAIEENTGKAIDKHVAIGKIDFLPYGELILHHVRINDKKDTPYARSRELRVRFKILPLIKDRRIIVTRIGLLDPVFFPPAKGLKVVFDQKETRNGYKLELNKSVVLIVKSGQAILARTNDISALDKVGFSFWAKLKKGDALYSKGVIDLRKYYLKDYLLNDIFFFNFIEKIGYEIKTSLVGETFSIDELLLDFEQFVIEAKGTVRNYKTDPVLNLRLALKELSLPEKATLRSKIFISRIRNFIIHIKGILKEPRWSVRLDKLKTKFVYLPAIVKIDNFYCDVKFSKEGFSVKNFSCFLNDFPIGLKCDIYKKEVPHVDISLMSYPGQIQSLRAFNPLNFEFSFSGHREKDYIRGKTFFEVDKLLSKHPRRSYNTRITVNDLQCKFSEASLIDEWGAVPLSLKSKDIIYETNIIKPGMRAEFAYFDSLLRPEGTKVHFGDLNLAGYEGFLKGDGFLTFNTLPPRIFLDFEFDKVNMSQLAEVLQLDYEMAGELSGEAIFDTKAFSYLSGKAKILNGHIRNLKVLGLISDFLSIISLKDIYFKNFSSAFSFSLTGKETSLSDIELQAENMYLSANFRLKGERKINGDILIRLSTALLKESSKLRMLLFLMGERLPHVDFEFKIGGLIGSPHIKWLDTKFKKGMMRYLSKGGRRALETEVEKAITPLLEGR